MVEYQEVSAQYNEHGQLVREERFDPNGNRNTLSLNKYNEKNLLVQSAQYDMDNILLQHSIFRYNENQQLVEQSNFFGEEEVEYVTQFIYDKEGNLLRHEMYDNGKFDFVEKEMEYQNGLLVKETENDDYGQKANEHFYTYNEKGLLIKHVREEIQNKDRRTYEYYYDEYDNCTKELVYDYSNSLIAKIYRKYNSDNKLVETEEEDLDNYRKITMEYDGDRVVKNTLFGREGNMIGWAEYTYDENGKENSASEFIQDEVRPEHYRMFRETLFKRG